MTKHDTFQTKLHFTFQNRQMLIFSNDPFIVFFFGVGGEGRRGSKCDDHYRPFLLLLLILFVCFTGEQNPFHQLAISEFPFTSVSKQDLMHNPAFIWTWVLLTSLFKCKSNSVSFEWLCTRLVLKLGLSDKNLSYTSTGNLAENKIIVISEI